MFIINAEIRVASELADGKCPLARALPTLITNSIARPSRRESRVMSPCRWLLIVAFASKVPKSERSAMT